jgi:hypothetical protein
VIEPDNQRHRLTSLWAARPSKFFSCARYESIALSVSGCSTTPCAPLALAAHDFNIIAVRIVNECGVVEFRQLTATSIERGLSRG